MKRLFIAGLLTLFMGSFAMAQAPAGKGKPGIHKKHHHRHHHHGPKKHM